MVPLVIFGFVTPAITGLKENGSSEFAQEVTNNDEIIISDEEAKKLLLERGYDPKYGARPLRRAIQKMVEDSLSNLMLEGTVKAGDKVLVTVADGELKFETEKK